MATGQAISAYAVAKRDVASQLEYLVEQEKKKRRPGSQSSMLSRARSFFDSIGANLDDLSAAVRAVYTRIKKIAWNIYQRVKSEIYDYFEIDYVPAKGEEDVPDEGFEGDDEEEEEEKELEEAAAASEKRDQEERAMSGGSTSSRAAGDSQSRSRSKGEGSGARGNGTGTCSPSASHNINSRSSSSKNNRGGGTPLFGASMFMGAGRASATNGNLGRREGTGSRGESNGEGAADKSDFTSIPLEKNSDDVIGFNEDF
jgi:hypothetical protein